MSGMRRWLTAALVAASIAACTREPAADTPRASGYVEATEVRVAPEVGGRVLSIAVDEGDRVNQGAAIATLDTTDTELAIKRVEAVLARESVVARLLHTSHKVANPTLPIVRLPYAL